VNRFPPIARGDLTLAQAHVVDHYEQGWLKPIADRHGGLPEHLNMTLRRPPLALALAGVSDYIRTGCLLPKALIEFAILVVAERCRSATEFEIHAPIAREAGIADDVIDALKRGERPTNLTPEQICAHRLAITLLAQRSVDDRLFKAACEAFTIEGYVDLVALIAYYGLVATALKAAGADSPQLFERLQGGQ